MAKNKDRRAWAIAIILGVIIAAGTEPRGLEILLMIALKSIIPIFVIAILIDIYCIEKALFFSI